MRRPITLNAKNAIRVVKAAVCLHNYLLCEDSDDYIQPGDIDQEDADHNVLPGAWHNEEPVDTFVRLSNCTGNRTGTFGARMIRDSIANYFQSADGMVHWQNRYAHIN